MMTCNGTDLSGSAIGLGTKEGTPDTEKELATESPRPLSILLP